VSNKLFNSRKRPFWQSQHGCIWPIAEWPSQTTKTRFDPTNLGKSMLDRNLANYYVANRLQILANDAGQSFQRQKQYHMGKAQWLQLPKDSTISTRNVQKSCNLWGTKQHLWRTQCHTQNISQDFLLILLAQNISRYQPTHQNLFQKPAEKKPAEKQTPLQPLQILNCPNLRVHRDLVQGWWQKVIKNCAKHHRCIHQIYSCHCNFK